MRSHQTDLTSGPLGRQIFAFSLPLMLSNVLQVLFNMADIAVAGRFGGPRALGAVGSTAVLVTLFTGFLIGVGSGVNVHGGPVSGRAGGPKTRRRRCTPPLLLSLIHRPGACCSSAGRGSPGICWSCSAPRRSLSSLREFYLRIYFLGMPALAVYNFGNAVFSASRRYEAPAFVLSRLPES